MWKRLRHSPLLNIFLIFLIVFVGYHTLNLARSTWDLYREARGSETKITELTKKKQELEAYLEELQQREAIEREAKERFNLKKPGEEVVVVIPDKNPPAAAPLTFFEKIRLFFARLLRF